MENEQDIMEGFRLSPQQKHLWLLQESGSLPFRSHYAALIEGEIDAAALRAALALAVSRNEILRTTFHRMPGLALPLQVVEEAASPFWEECDLRPLEAAQQNAAVNALIDAAARMPFDFERGPLLRVWLACLGDDRHLLLLSAPALSMDAIGLRNLVREIHAEDVDDKPAQYADLTEWQNNLLESEESAVDREAWRRQDLSALDEVRLPFERRPREHGPFDPQVVTSRLDPALAAALESAAGRHDVPLSALLLSCWTLLLGRLTGRSDLVIGAAFDGRSYEGLGTALGLFGKVLQLRLDGGEGTLRKLVRQVADAVQEAHDGQEYFSWELSLGGAEGDGTVRFAPFCFELQDEPAAVVLGGVSLRTWARHSCIDRFSVKLACDWQLDSRLVELHYDAGCIDRNDASRLAGQVEALLREVADGVEPVELNGLSEAECQQLLVELNDTQRDFHGASTVQALFEEQVARGAGRPALVCEDTRLSHGELNVRANRLAHHLRSLGAGAEVVVAICLDRSVEMVVALLAVLKAGGAYLPLDPSQPSQRLALMLEESGARVLVTQQRCAGMFLQFSGAVVCLDRDREVLARQSGENPVSGICPENLAYILFTSGSTGRPKGVAVEQRQLSNYLLGVVERIGFAAVESFATVSTFAADLGNTMIFPALCTGGCLHVISSERISDAEALGRYIGDEAIGALKIVPSHLEALLSAHQPERVLPRQRLVLGGEASRWDLVARLERLSPDCVTFNHYGPTETTVGILTYRIETGHVHPYASTVPLGRPLPNSRIFLLDLHFRPVSTLVPGELYIGGEGLARGYLHRPDLTAERFVPDPLSDRPGSRLYRTGDLARYLPDSQIEFLGRVDNQVKIRGFRIELGEIEAALRQHPAVREAVVLAREDAPGDKRLVGYVVVDPDSSPSTGELRGFLQQALPEYMVPPLLMPLKSLPLNANGKVDRQALPRPSADQQDLPMGRIAPRTLVEEVLAAIWSELLGRERLSVEDSFFEMGGHSLLATQMVGRLRTAFGVEVPLRTLFEAPTVAALGEHIERARRAGATLEAPLLEAVPRSGSLPLSFAQQRLWFLDQWEPGSTAYNMPTRLRMIGRLNEEALESALCEIVRRHESLRTMFESIDGEPVQEVRPPGAWALPRVDLGALQEEEREREAQRLVQEEARRPFDLSRGPLFRVSLLRLAGEEHLFLGTMHHIISDGWSMGVLTRELGVLYRACSAGAPSPLPDLPIQYGDFAHWQRRWLAGAVLETEIRYWRDKLAGAPPVLELPADRLRPAIRSFRGARERLQLTPELTAALQALGRHHGATAFMVLLAAFQTLLGRYTGRDDLIVGTPIAGRNREETENLIGFFVNTLVLRTDASGDPPFLQLLDRVRAAALSAHEHQDLPFEKLVEEIEPERSLSFSPLFQVMFTLQNAPRSLPELPDLELQVLGTEEATAKFDLTLALAEGADGLRGSFEFSTDLFDRTTITGMVDHFRNLLEGIADDPGRRLSGLPLLTEAEEAQLAAWSVTAPGWAFEQPVHRLFEEQAARAPEALAVAGAGQRLTYGALDRLADRWASRLRELGVGPDVPAGVLMDRSPDMVVAILAILKAGGAYLPLDPASPRERLAFLVEDARLAVILTQRRLRDELPRTGIPVLATDEGEAPEAPPADRSPAVEADGLAYVIYTSGSTGRPKGVEVPHRGLANLVAWHCRTYGLTDRDRCMQIAGPAFDASVWEVWPPLTVGASLHIAPEEARTSAPELLRWAVEERVTSGFLPTPLAEAVLAEEPPAGLALRALLTGGDKLHRSPGRQLPFALFNHYGPTEGTVVATSTPVSPGDAVPSIGRPIDGVSIHLLDRNLVCLPPGIPGELCVGGVGLARGYRGRPDLTAERFLPDPFAGAPGARLYRTGDLVRHRPDGAIEFLGRIDHQVKVQGFRIELGEIEAVLEKDPAVREAVVLAHDGATGDRRLLACVVPQAGAAATPEALRTSLRRFLPDYMVPAAFVVLDALPLTPNGKVDRRALALLGAERMEGDREVRAPRSWTEEVLASIWCEVLRLERVGIGEDFFALGGHSLLATQVVSRAQKAFGVPVHLRELFELPTVAGLAASIESRRRAGSAMAVPPLEPMPRSGRLPLSFAQQRLWFLDQWNPGDTTYNIPAAVRLEGPLRVEVLEAALGEIVHRHESLRTTFDSVQGEPAQNIHPPASWVLPVVDLSALGEGARDEEALRLTGEAARHRFRLARGPLLWIHLLQLGRDEHVLLATMHHIVSDGWSKGVLTRELGILYEAFAAGSPSPLAELPIQYADFAAWQRQWLAGEVLDAELGYWREQLAGAPAVLELPADRPRPSVQSYHGASASFALAPALTARLQEVGRRAGATAFMTLLAAFKTLLGRYTGREDLSVGTPVAGRNRVEIEELIGFFVNTLVLRTSLSGDPSFRELLVRVREVALTAQLHQDLPFEKVVEELDPERSPSHSPLFQVLFALQNAPRVALKLPGLTLRTLPGKSSTAKFDLSLVLWDSAGGGLSGALEYTTDLFEERTVCRLLGHFEALLDGIAESPDQRLSELSLLREGERAQLLSEWSGPGGAGRRDRCLHELFKEQAARTPDALALVAEEERLSYRELDERSNRLARQLRPLGVQPEVVTGLCVRRSAGMIVGMLGIVKAGGVYLPLDPAYPVQRRVYMLRDSGARVLLTERALLEDWDDLSAGPALAVVCLGSCLDADLPEAGGPDVAGRVDPAHLAYLIYTSGSTGEPKGVGVEHGAAADHFEAVCRELGLEPQDRVLQFASSSFDVSLEQIFATFQAGAALVLRGEEVPDPAGLSSWLARSGVTVANLPTAYWQQWIADNAAPADAPLRLVIAGGEAMPAEAVSLWEQAPVRGARLLNAYGPTEAVITATVFDLAPEAVRSDAAATVPIGRPLALRRAHILDRSGHLLPAGVPGELCLGGLLARGYLGRPGATAEKFIPDPFAREPGGRLYRTGDLAVLLPDGNLRFLGRFDQQVKVRGYRIELQEIESLLGRHPAVQAAVVLVKEEGSGDKRLIAFVAMSPEASIAELRRFLLQSLPDYMIPAAFVALESLPLTPNGKVDRQALLRLGEGPPEVEEGGDAAATLVQELLSGIWCEVLGLAEVGIEQNFFALGGHSLLAARVVSRVRNAFRVEIPVRALFEAPTVARLAEVIESLRQDGLLAQAPPLERVPRTERLPLSFAQQRLWFLDQWEPGNPAYNLPSVLRIEGPLRPDVLESALGEIVRRHESLRTTFEPTEGEPVQKIHSAGAWVLPVLDLGGLAEAVREEEARRLVRDEALHPFDLVRGPIFRACLVRLAEQDHIATATVHHIASDGWSLGVMTRELEALYRAHCAGLPSPLAELPIQYADFSHWQRRWLSGEVLEAELGYWREQLAGAPAMLDLPTDRPRPAVWSRRGASEPLRLPAGLTASLQALGRREGATPFMTLVGAFQVLLGRYAREENVSIGAPIAGRNRVETEGLIGFFVNTLVLRTELSGDPTFRELLGRVRDVSLAAHAHQNLPFEKLVEEIEPERSLSYPPLFQVMFAMQNTPAGALDLPDLKLRRLGLESTAAKFDLTLTMAESVGTFRGALEYSTDLFDGPTVRRILSHFETLLRGVVAAPGARLSELSLLSEEEKAQLLVEWNDTRAAGSSDSCLHELVEEQVERTPSAVAVVFEGEHLTYRELDRRADQLANRLRRMGVGPEVTVALCVERSLEMVVGLLGVFKAGGAYVPLDPEYPRERLELMITDAGVSVLLTQQRLLDQLPASDAQVICLDAGRADIAEPESRPVRWASPDHLAYVIYTSGSTGRPKGVMIRHRGVANRLLWAQAAYPVTAADRVLQKASFSFDFSVWECFGPLLVGARLILARPGGHRDSEYLVSTIVKEEITLIHFVPSMLQVFLAGDGLERCASLRYVFSGGETLPAELRDLFYTRMSSVLRNQYGPTEISIDVTEWVCRPEERGSQRPVSIGRPIANSATYVLDERLRPTPIGVPGELFLGGAGVARGYLRRPGLTAERFVPDPFGGEPGGRLYRTGDLVRHRPDGTLDFLGRRDHQVKVRGFRIELGEIESLLDRHPSVHESVVLARGDSVEERRLVAYVVAKPGSVGLGGLREHMRQLLPEHMVPAAFVELESLPLTQNGKVDRQALLRLVEGRPEAEEGGGAAETLVQELLTGIWCEVLGRPEIGIEQNFFDLGGHSLLAARVVSRMRDAFRVEIPLRALFEAPTVARLAGTIEALRRDGLLTQAPPLERVPRTERLPLSFAQQRLWFLDQWEPGNPAYNLPSVLRLEGHLRVEVLERALEEIVRRHESLRTTFEPTDGEPVQKIHPAGTWVLPVLDLAGLDEAVCEEEARRLARAEVLLPFDLASGPLFRARLLRLGAEDHVAVLTLHHIASDGWSMGVMTRELEILYKAGSSGSPALLPELAIQYADFADWQRRWLSGERLDQEIAYWRKQLAGMPAVLDLPTDRPRPAVQGFRGAQEMLRLPEELAESLQALGRGEGATLFMVLLAGFHVLLGRQAGSDDVNVGTPTAGRNRVETENLIGFFVNTLVLRSDLSGDPTFRQLLERIREVALAAHSHQDLPFEKVVEELEPERGLSHRPLFQVMFALQNARSRALDLPGLRLRPLVFESSTAKFDLTLSLVRGAVGLRGALEYSTDLFDGSTVRRMLGHLETLLQGIVADPGRRIAELPLLTEGERSQILLEWNQVRSHAPDRCLHTLFREQVERSPDAMAVVFGERRLSYRELDLQAGRLALRLRKAGVTPDTPVALCLERSLEMVVGIVGILAAGGLYVPLDPSYPLERLAFILKDSGVAVLVTQSERLPELPAHGARVLLLDSGNPDLDAEAEDPYGTPEITPETGAYLIYTSGSTGTPKGVVVTHANVVRLFNATDESFHFDAGDVWTLFHSYAFDFSVWEIWGALLYGGRLVVVPYLVSRSPDTFYELLCRERVTVLNQTPSAFRQLIQAEQAAEPGAEPALRLVIFGGEALEIQSLEPWWARHGDERPRLVNMYGITETTVHVTYRPLTVADLAGAPGSAIGVPIPDLRIDLLDPGAQLVPIGVPGEVHVGGAGLARGYFQRPALTAQRFVPDPFGAVPGDRLYRTGDLARYLPNGDLEYLGRIDNQVKIRGFRIELGEIESVLARHPSIGEAVALVREDAPGDKRLVAYVIPLGVAVTGDEMVSFLRERLPEYMVPSAFVFLETLPLTPNGKVDRRALPAPERERRSSSRESRGPRDEIELELVRIWEDLLGVAPIGVTNNFFELGGHSLLAVRLLAVIRKRFGQRSLGRDLPLAVLFQGPTIEELARILRGRSDAPARSSLIPLDPTGSGHPFFCVHPVGGNVFCYVDLVRLLGGKRPVYALQSRDSRDAAAPEGIEEMAAQYIEELRAVQPEGPYLLGGWSFGGLVAFEMARQMKRTGQEVALLALIDSAVPEAAASARDLDEVTGLLLMAKDLEGVTGRSLQVGAEDLKSLGVEGGALAVLERARDAGILPPDADLEQLHRLSQVYRRNLRSLRHYLPSDYPGRITLFRAEQRNGRGEHDTMDAWTRLATGGVVVHSIPGDHYTAMRTPHVDGLARILRACLDEADPEGLS